MDTSVFDIEYNYSGRDLANALREAADFVERIGEDRVEAIQWSSTDATGHEILIVYRKK